MLIYLLLMFFTSLFFYLYKKCNNKFLKIIFLVLTILFPSLVAGLRDISVGTDLKVYVNYQYIITKNFSSFIQYVNFLNVDLFYGFLTYFSSKIIYDFNFYLFLIQLINTLCFVTFLNSVDFKTQSKIPYFIAFFIYFITFYFKSLNLVRQHLAISFILLFFTYFISGNKKKSYLFFIVACLFHSSAIICILIPVIYYLSNSTKKSNKVCLILFILILFFSLIFFSDIFKIIINLNIFKNISTLSLSFLNQNFEFDKVDSFFKVFWLFVFIIIGKNKKIENYSFLISLAFIDFIFYEYNIYVMFGERLSLYFTTILYVSFIPQIYKILKNNTFNKIFFSSFVIVLFVAYFILKYVIQNAGAVYPYISVLGG